MPKKISYDGFIEKCKLFDDFENVSFEYVNKKEFKYSDLQKFKCNNHNKIFYRYPKTICKNKLEHKFICNNCRIDYISKISNTTGICKPRSGKLIKFSYNDILDCLKQKNSNVSLVSPAKECYVNKDVLNLNCDIHGKFEKRVQLIFRSKWICNECNKENIVKSNIRYGEERRKEFVEEAHKVHGDEYDYSLVDTSGKLSKISIICKIHGVFSQMPSLHLRGEGCPLCTSEGISNNERRLGYCIRKRFPNIKLSQQWSGDILGRQKLDYFIPKFNIGIEYQGPQHFIDVDFFNDYRHNLDHRKRLDKIKYDICKKNGIKVLYFTFNKEFDGIEYFDKVYTNLSDLYDKMSKIMSECH